MYRDDPLDDEMELRDLVGDDVVDDVVARASDGDEALAVALDILHVLRGWVDDRSAARWFVAGQRRLGGRTPVEALGQGAFDEVSDAARAWAAAQG